jgi:hypothetical protein
MRSCAVTWTSASTRSSTSDSTHCSAKGRRGLLSAPPELLGEITRGAVERLLNSQLPRELNCTAADLLRATVDTVLYGAIRPGSAGEQEVNS